MVSLRRDCVTSVTNSARGDIPQGGDKHFLALGTGLEMHATARAPWLPVALGLLALGPLGCPPAPANPAGDGGRARVVGVSGGAAPAVRAADWCDRLHPLASAPALALPPSAALQAGGPLRPAAGRWTWLNLWATWCKPCLREMPLIRAFGERLREEGFPVDNWYLDLDEEPEALEAFLASRPELRGPGSLRARAPELLDRFLVGLGLESGTAIPVNVLADPEGRVRCVRLGSIHDGDYPVVRDVLRELAGPGAR